MNPSSGHSETCSLKVQQHPNDTNSWQYSPGLQSANWAICIYIYAAQYILWQPTFFRCYILKSLFLNLNIYIVDSFCMTVIWKITFRIYHSMYIIFAFSFLDIHATMHDLPQAGNIVTASPSLGTVSQPSLSYIRLWPELYWGIDSSNLCHSSLVYHRP